MSAPTPLLGVFVGGRSRRMAGRPKGLLLRADGRSLLEGLVEAGREAGCEVALVGDADPYAGLCPDVPRLADAPAGVGPLGGLSALLDRGAGRPCLAVACDMPHVDAASLARLLAHAPDAAVVAPRRAADAPWEPLFARYDSDRVAPALAVCLEQGVRSFQRLFERLEVTPLPVDAALARALTDWDTPEDLEGGG